MYFVSLFSCPSSPTLGACCAFMVLFPSPCLPVPPAPTPQCIPSRLLCTDHSISITIHFCDQSVSQHCVWSALPSEHRWSLSPPPALLCFLIVLSLGYRSGVFLLFFVYLLLRRAPGNVEAPNRAAKDVVIFVGMN